MGMYETNLPALDWNTILALGMMTVSTFLICLWAASDFHASNLPQRAWLENVQGEKDLYAGDEPSLSLQRLCTASPGLTRSFKSTVDLVVQSKPKIDLQSSISVEEIELQTRVPIKAPYSPSIPKASRRVRAEGLLAPSRSREGQQTEDAGDVKHLTTKGQWKGRPVPGLPHPSKSILLPRTSGSRGNNATKGKFRARREYDEERDEQLLGDLG